jgi:taurine dehydrogenase small subunit
MPSVAFLESFAEGWNRHDVDGLMEFMADDCAFETTAGPDVWGKRYEGRERVREAFAGVFKRFPDAHFGDGRHFVAGDRGCSEWTFTGTASDGKRVEVYGCDLFTFRNGKIALKASFFKNRTA